MELVLQKSKQVKTRADFNGKRVGSKNGKASISGLPGLQFDAYFVSKVVEVVRLHA